jgi:hypothetical protein
MYSKIEANPQPASAQWFRFGVGTEPAGLRSSKLIRLRRADIKGQCLRQPCHTLGSVILSGEKNPGSASRRTHRRMRDVCATRVATRPREEPQTGKDGGLRYLLALVDSGPANHPCTPPYPRRGICWRLPSLFEWCAGRAFVLPSSLRRGWCRAHPCTKRKDGAPLNLMVGPPAQLHTPTRRD